MLVRPRILVIGALGLLLACRRAPQPREATPPAAEAVDRPTPSAEAAPLSSADRARVLAVDSAFLAAVNAGDLAALLATYEPDASLLAPNSPPHEGREAIRKYWAGFLDAYTVAFEAGADEIEGQGDLAYVVGHYMFQAQAKRPGGSSIEDQGKFVEILRRQPDGSWRYVVDIFNSNLEPAGN